MTSQVLTSFVPAPAPSPPYESDIEAELEVDQLDSDSEIDEVTDPSKPSTSKNSTSKPGERSPGHTLLPTVRLENMLQAEGVTGNMTLSKEAMFVLSIATEDFIKRFIQAGHREASAHRRNQINYLDMAIAATTQQYQEFMFLSDTIPLPIILMQALHLKQEKEREQLEDNPALAHLSPPPSAWMPPPSMHEAMDYDVSKQKKTRSTNGKEHKRSQQSAASNGHPPQVTHGMDMDDSEPYADHHANQFGFNRQGPSTTSAIPTPYINGAHTPPFEESINATSPHPPVHYPGAHSPSYHSEEEPQWSGSTPPFTGPASGILRGPVPSYSPSSPNPGRTIYNLD